MFETITRRSKPVPPLIAQLSERDKLAAELEYETGLLPELTLLVKLGRRDRQDLDARHRQITELQRQLNGLDEAAERQREREEDRRVNLPSAEKVFTTKLAAAIDRLVDVRNAFIDLHRDSEEIINRFGDHRHPGWLSVPRASNDVLSLLGTGGNPGGGFMFEFIDKNGDAYHWLREALEAGFTVPGVQPRPVIGPPYKPEPAKKERVK